MCENGCSCIAGNEINAVGQVGNRRPKLTTSIVSGEMYLVSYRQHSLSTPTHLVLVPNEQHARRINAQQRCKLGLGHHPRLVNETRIHFPIGQQLTDAVRIGNGGEKNL